jgi:hypothetical protein
VKWLFAFVAVCGSSALLATSGRVQTSTGASFAGEISIDPALGLVITNDDIGSTNVPLANVLSAEFNRSSETGATNEAPAVAGALLSGWTNVDVGRATVAGKARFEKGIFTLSSSGTRVWSPEPDEFHFVYRKFTGNGQLVAEITKLDAAMAGIMFRQTLEPNSQFVLQGATQGPEGLVFRTRRDAAHRELVHMQGEWMNREEIKPPCWVKLIRKEKRFTAYKSDDDGITWQPIYDSATEWDRQILAGVFVVGGDSNSLKQASFANVTVEDDLDYQAKSTNGPPKIQVFLNDGSILATESVSADRTKMRIAFANTNYSASVVAVARVILKPVPDRLQPELTKNRKGVLLYTGDFFEGELRLLDKQEIKLESILFGPRTFQLDRVLAVTLSDSIALPAKYVIHTLDGSVIRAKEISARADALMAEELKLGPLELPLARLAELKSGSANLGKNP